MNEVVVGGLTIYANLILLESLSRRNGFAIFGTEKEKKKQLRTQRKPCNKYGIQYGSEPIILLGVLFFFSFML